MTTARAKCTAEVNLCDACDHRGRNKAGTPCVQCGGHVTGRTCQKYAIEGGTVCRSHGGNAPQVRAAAEARLAEQRAMAEVQRLGLPVEVDPVQALLEDLYEKAGLCAWLRVEVEALDGTDGSPILGRNRHQERVLHPVYVAWTHAMEARANAAALCVKVGIAERQVAIAEKQGELIAQVIRAALADLGLTAEQQRAALAGAGRHLRLLTAGDTATA